MGMKDSPSSQVFSSSVRLGAEEFYDPEMLINRPVINFAPRVGIGLSIFNETNGPLRHTGLLFAYAYHIPIRENRLSFGLSGKVTQYHLNTQDFKPVTTDDPGLYDNTSAIVPDVNFGAMYYGRKLFIGIAANELVNFNKVMDHTKSFPDIVVYGGYKFLINSNFKFEPSLYFWEFGKGIFLADINCKLYYRNKNWLLLAYHGSGNILAGIGLSIKKEIQMSYTYAASTAGIATYYSGNHAISIRVDIGGLVKKY
jgi:type IX secretion system PorP/SprF family membrane protein